MTKLSTFGLHCDDPMPVSRIILYADTEPTAIANNQRQVIIDAMTALSTTDPATISDYVTLPISVVIRRIRELQS